MRVYVQCGEGFEYNFNNKNTTYSLYLDKRWVKNCVPLDS